MTLESEELADMAALGLLIMAAAVVVEEGGNKVGRIRVMPVSLPFAGQQTGAYRVDFSLYDPRVEKKKKLEP